MSICDNNILLYFRDSVVTDLGNLHITLSKFGRKDGCTGIFSLVKSKVSLRNRRVHRAKGRLDYSIFYSYLRYVFIYRNYYVYIMPYTIFNWLNNDTIAFIYG